MKKCILCILMLVSTVSFAFSQVKISENQGVANENSILELESESKGLLLPRLFSNRVELMSKPVSGLLVFDKTTNRLRYFSGNQWANVISSKEFDYQALTNKVQEFNNDLISLKQQIESLNTLLNEYINAIPPK